ncbi:hypothetical protein PINS_up007806 [Pythium insidiosum]|nr:hypothetical protein PINS_up007806 [Pythium insidiosum]
MYLKARGAANEQDSTQQQHENQLALVPVSASASSSSSRRRRSSSVELWFQKVLGLDPLAAERKERRRVEKEERRAKRKTFIRKLFRPQPKALTASDDDAALRRRITHPASQYDTTFRLDDVYGESIRDIIDQYRADVHDKDDAAFSPRGKRCDGADADDDSDESTASCGSSGRSSRSSSDADDKSPRTAREPEDLMFVLPEEADDSNQSEADSAVAAPPLSAAPSSSSSSFSSSSSSSEEWVEPPVQVPVEYAVQDRRGGTLVAGHYVLFTSGAFKRKQRQLHYQMRRIPEDAAPTLRSVHLNGSDYVSDVDAVSDISDELPFEELSLPSSDSEWV